MMFGLPRPRWLQEELSSFGEIWGPGWAKCRRHLHLSKQCPEYLLRWSRSGGPRAPGWLQAQFMEFDRGCVQSVSTILIRFCMLLINGCLRVSRQGWLSVTLGWISLKISLPPQSLNAIRPGADFNPRRHLSSLAILRINPHLSLKTPSVVTCHYVPEVGHRRLASAVLQSDCSRWLGRFGFG